MVQKKLIDFPTREHNANCEKKRFVIEVVLLTEQRAVEKIVRKCLISLLYKPVDKVKGITHEQLDIEEINSFVNGVRRNQSTVEKTNTAVYNSGLT